MTPAKYNELNELLSDYSKASASLEETEARITTVQLKAASGMLPKHANSKILLADLEAKLRKIADENYDELFPEDKKRTHKTPFGEVKFHKSTSLEVADEASTLRRFKSAGKADDLIRKVEKPNLEALEKLDDQALADLGITRVKDDNFSVKPFAMKNDKPAKKAKQLQEAA